MNRENLLNRVARQPLLGDGGMGTQLLEAGLTTADNAVAWNVDKPDVIRRIHDRYCAAGCDLATTNTFQGSRTALQMHGLSDRAAELNGAAARIAREAADNAPDRGDRGRPVVLADVGPFGGFLEPLGETTETQLLDIFTEQFAALHEGGADVALIETMSDYNEVRIAIEAAKQVADWPVIATYAFQTTDNAFVTMMGSEPDALIRQTLDAGADIVGANCGTGIELDGYKLLAEQVVEAAGDVPAIIQPNAGTPQTTPDGQTYYAATPEQMAALVPALLDLGIRIIGGCCGTTPEHLRAMGNALHAATE
jgi:methionine synthase I (cobalamin-dependent)